MEIFKDFQPDISLNEVCRLLGRGGSKAASPRTVRKVKRLIEETTPILSPRVVSTEKSIRESKQGTIVIEPDLSFRSRKMTKTLGSCKKAKVFVATVGPEIEEEIQKFTDENRMSEASILDAIASVAIENTVDQFQKMVDEELSDKGLGTTLRFSPGYCDWPIQEQRKVFQVVDGEKIDVSLTDTCLMHPRKSVSGVFGISHDDGGKQRNLNPCTQCGMRHCTARRKTDSKSKEQN